MVIITIFGVGYGEVGEMTPNLRIFTIFFIVMGCTTLIYTLGAFINWLTEGQLQQILGRHRMEKEIKKISQHTVICGYGRVGRILASDLKKGNKPFIIIENAESLNESLRASGYSYIIGDATEDEVLMQAGIERASSLATVIPNDAINLFIVLSSRSLNPELTIISRANQATSEAKLYHAGCNKVIMPETIGAEKMAHLILKPNAEEVLKKDLRDNSFIESLLEIGIEMNEIPISSDIIATHTTIEDLETKGNSAFMIVAVRKSSGEAIIKPPLNQALEKGDTLIVMSHQGVVPQFIRENLVKPSRKYRGISH